MPDNPVFYIVAILVIGGLVGRWAESWVDKRVQRGIAEHEERAHGGEAT